MHPKRRPWIALLKLLVAAAILVAIGRQFYQDLSREEIRSIDVRLGWLVASAVVYLIAMAFSGLFWLRLMYLFDQRVDAARAFKAYFVGHLGKYLPGKAWALWLRGDLVRGPHVSMSVSIVTAFYEVLTTMATGALVAAVVFFVEPPQFRGLDFPPYLTGLFLLAACGVPLLPGVFNILATRLARKFEGFAVFHVPRLRLSILLQGIALISVGWGLMGLSVWLCLAGVLEPTPELTLGTWAYYCAIIGLAYVIGFAAFVLPAGFGAREWVLREFLLFAGPPPGIAASVLLLRVSWTAGEVLLAATLSALVPRAKHPVADIASETPLIDGPTTNASR
jgi:uncharacterized membrane protein YbhN (UPF0104 family)